jgi:predicted phosphodiesterase
MKIHLLSDIHSEFIKGSLKTFFENLLAPADILVLAGDIAVGKTNLLQAVEFFAKHYKHVILVLGNHEAYNGLGLTQFDGLETPSNVHILNPGSVTLEGITFTGGTLWTNFGNDPRAVNTAKSYINDFKRGITTDEVTDLYNEHLEFIKQNPADIIVTHFLPCKECIDPRYLNPTDTVLNKYFANDLTEYIKTLDTKYWLFGHTHSKVDTQVGTTRLLANPLGYPGENEHYSNLVIEV